MLLFKFLSMNSDWMNLAAESTSLSGPGVGWGGGLESFSVCPANRWLIGAGKTERVYVDEACVGERGLTNCTRKQMMGGGG